VFKHFFRGTLRVASIAAQHAPLYERANALHTRMYGRVRPASLPGCLVHARPLTALLC
jgi:hypothetical protein